MEMYLARDTKNSNKGFYRYIGEKRKAKECVPPLRNDKEKLTTTDIEKAEILKKFFSSVFTGSKNSHISHIPYFP